MLSQQGVIETPVLGLCFPCLLLLWQWCLSGELAQGKISFLLYLVFAWLLKGKKGTSASARKVVVLMEVAFWQQLTVGLQLTSEMKKAGT